MRLSSRLAGTAHWTTAFAAARLYLEPANPSPLRTSRPARRRTVVTPARTCTARASHLTWPCSDGFPAHGSGQPGRTPPLGGGFAATRPLRRLPKPPTSHPGARGFDCPATQANRTSPPRSGRRRRPRSVARPPGVIAPAHLQRFPCQRAVQQQRADSRHRRDLRGHHLLAGGPLAKLLALRDERGTPLEQLVVHAHLVVHARPPSLPSHRLCRPATSADAAPRCSHPRNGRWPPKPPPPSCCRCCCICRCCAAHHTCGCCW